MKGILMHDKPVGIAVIECIAWAFFAICAITEARWLILRVVCQAGWGAPDWGTWVGAIGTFSALLAAVFLSTSETRRREAADFDRARLAAAPLYFKMKNLSHILDDLLAIDPAELLKSPNPFFQFSQRLNNASIWAAEDLVPLTVLPNHAAFHMEVARAKIEHCVNSMMVEASTGEFSGAPEAFLAALRAIMRGAQKSVTIALVEVEQIIPNIHPD
jgi:hypothetical protein